MVLKSYSKVNLFLRILNRRRDNFHNIETIFERIDLCDGIVLMPRKDDLIRIICKDPSVPADKTNLCYRSADLLRKSCRVNKGVDITIRKNIPVGAGLGGGSGNAATVLLGLNKLWRLGLSRKKLAQLGARIGSDIAFFVYEAPFALGRGRGEKIKPISSLSNTRFWHILAVPKIHVSTPLIYRKYDQYSGLTASESSVKILLPALVKKDLPLVSEGIFNSLEAITIRLYPEVRRVKKTLADSGLKSILMSGSGPAVFAIASSKKEAVLLRNRLAKKYRSWRIFAVRTR